MSTGQGERLDYLLGVLRGEYSEPQAFPLPAGYAKRRALLRMLVNLRPPRPLTEEFLRVQDAFLQQEAQEKGIVELSGLTPTAPGGRLFLWQGDITRLAADAIVNAANAELLGCFVPGHSCIDNAIHTAAGVQLRQECHKIMAGQSHPEGTGLARMTGGHNLPARHVIHTVGPIVEEAPTPAQERQLAQCYTACLAAAAAAGLGSVAFCCISTGVFAFPAARAAEIAVETVKEFLAGDTVLEQVIFDVFTDEDRAIYQRLL